MTDRLSRCLSTQWRVEVLGNDDDVDLEFGVLKTDTLRHCQDDIGKCKGRLLSPDQRQLMSFSGLYQHAMDMVSSDLIMRTSRPHG